MKQLSIQRQKDPSTWFISLLVKKGDSSKRLGVSVTRQEWATLQILARVRTSTSSPPRFLLNVPHIEGRDSPSV